MIENRMTQAIGSQNLDFTINYSSRDELGEVCAQFEVTRKQLADNNSRMWKMLEQERALRASIAHDIRSPLTILKGYQEMLLELVPDNPERSEAQEVMADMLQEGMAQIRRMEDFLGSMNQLSALEDRQIQLREIRLSELAGQYGKNLEILATDSGKECELCLAEYPTDKLLRIDVGIVTEVLENLLTNALRYAEKKVTVLLSVRGSKLYVEVLDDGPGFAADAETLTNPHYHANPQDDLTHFGIGLYICRIYCEKPGGRLLRRCSAVRIQRQKMGDIRTLSANDQAKGSAHPNRRAMPLPVAVISVGICLLFGAATGKCRRNVRNSAVLSVPRGSFDIYPVLGYDGLYPIPSVGQQLGRHRDRCDTMAVCLFHHRRTGIGKPECLCLCIPGLPESDRYEMALGKGPRTGPVAPHGPLSATNENQKNINIVLKSAGIVACGKVYFMSIEIKDLSVQFKTV